MRISLPLMATLLAMTLLIQPARAASAGIELDSVNKAAVAYQNPNNLAMEQMFRKALLNTMRQASYSKDGTVYLKTGDIPAEWLRDSSAQARPYLFFAAQDPAVRDLMRGIIARQGKYLQLDPYANAFTENYGIWERKYELDSLAYPILLAWTYWKTTGDSSIFTSDLSLGFDAALNTMVTEQNHATQSQYKNPHLSNKGHAFPVSRNGMVWSGFRPSDDACRYNYLIPSEMMAVVALGALSEIERSVYHDQDKASKAQRIRQEIHQGIQKHGIVHDSRYGDVYAYEVDGRGNYMLGDDANSPSLLSAPYFGYGSVNDRVYQNTRRLLLSRHNPYYYRGAVASGIGSPHTPHGYIWPLALVIQSLTSTNKAERDTLLTEILASDPGDHLLHESFDRNDAKRFTRPDFGWPNALFSEMVLQVLPGRQPLPNPSNDDLKFR